MSDSSSKTPTPGSGSAGARRRRRRAWWIAAPLAVVALGGAIRVALPEVLRSVAESQAARALGTDVRIDDIDLWLLSGGVSIDGIRVGDADPTRPGFGIDHAFAQLRWSDLFTRTAHFERVVLGGLTLRAWRRPGGEIEIYAATEPAGVPTDGAAGAPAADAMEPDAEEGEASPPEPVPPRAPADPAAEPAPAASSDERAADMAAAGAGEEPAAPAEPDPDEPSESPGAADSEEPPPTPDAADPDEQSPTPDSADSEEPPPTPAEASSETERPEALSTEPSEPAPAADDGAWTILIDRVELSDIDVVLHDQRFDVPREGILKLELLAMTGLEYGDRRLGFGSIEIEGPTLRFPIALALAGGEASEPEPVEAGEPFEFGVTELNIRRAGVLVVGDQPLDVAFHLAARDVTARPNTLFPVELDLTIGGAEEARELEVRGRLGLGPLTFDGHIEWRQIVLSNLIAVFSDEAAPWVDAGRSSGALDVTLRLPAPGGDGTIPDGIRAHGEFRVDEFALAHGGAKEDDISLAFDSLEVAVREVRVPMDESARGTEVALARVALQRPVARIALAGAEPGGSPSDGEAAGASRAEPTPADGDEPAPDAESDGGLQLTIDALEVANGDVTLIDRTVRPFFRGRLRQLQVSARDAAWPGSSVGDFALTAQTNDEGSLAVRGKISPGAHDGEVHVEIEKLPLGPFNPYATRFSKYLIGGGAASLASDLEIDGSRYTARNSLVLYDFDLSERASGTFQRAFGVPLQVGLALLRDVSGDISLQVPVTVSAEGTNVGLGSVIRRALQGAVTSALISPLKVLGMLLPTGKSVESLTLPVEFVAGRAEATAEGHERIGALAQVLASRPTLAVVLHGQVGDADRPQLAREELAALSEAGDDWPEIEGGGWLTRRRVAAAVVAEASGESAELSSDDAQALERWSEAVTVPATRVDDLAARRAAVVRDELVATHGLPEARVRVAEGAASGEPGVAAELEPAGG